MVLCKPPCSELQTRVFGSRARGSRVFWLKDAWFKGAWFKARDIDSDNNHGSRSCVVHTGLNCAQAQPQLTDTDRILYAASCALHGGLQHQLYTQVLCKRSCIALCSRLGARVLDSRVLGSRFKHAWLKGAWLKGAWLKARVPGSRQRICCILSFAR